MANKVTRGAPTSSASVVLTKDRFTAHTLYVDNIPQHTSKELIKHYFSKFGVVKSVSINKHKRRKETDLYQYGFVTFEQPESAAAALNKSNHSGISKRLKVRAASNVKQPPIVNHRTNTENMKCDESDDIQTRMWILDLNDDCLLHLFSFLTSAERFTMSLACCRFKYINERHIKLNYIFDFNDMKSFPMMETDQIVSLFSNYIKRIRIGGESDILYNQQHLLLVEKYCQNLEELDFNCLGHMSLKTIERIFSSTNKIKSLKLQNCALNNEICSLISKQSHLQRLNLSYNSGISGKYLDGLKNLSELSLENCTNIESTYFIDICKATQLKALNILTCYLLDDAAFDILVSTQKELEEIVISNAYCANNMEILSHLPKLKRIQIHRVMSFGFESDILFEISHDRKDQLESLEMYYMSFTRDRENLNDILEFRNLKSLCLFCDKSLDDSYLIEIANNCSQLVEVIIAGSSSVTAVAIKEIVSTLKQLKRLDISFCYQFENKLYDELIQFMREKNSMPLTLCVANTSIDPAILKSNKYKQNKKLLTLSFEVDRRLTRPRFSQFPDYDMSESDYDDDFDDDDGFDEDVIIVGDDIHML